MRRSTLRIGLWIGCTLLAGMTAADWVRTNPGGGGAFLAAESGPDGTIVVGSDLSGAYISHDRGESWGLIGPLNGMDQTHVSDVRFDPQNAHTLMLGTNRGIYRSADGGDSFVRVLEPPLVPGQNYPYAAMYVTEIRFAPSDSDVVYAAVHLKVSFGSGAAPFDGFVYRSDDNGVNWVPVSDPSLPLDSDIVKIEIAPDDVNRLFALTGRVRSLDQVTGGKLFESSDGGISWSATQTEHEPIMDIAIAPYDADIIYMSRYDDPVDLEGTIFKSVDGGNQFAPIRQGYSGVIWLHPADVGRVRLIDPRRAFPWWEKSGTWETTDAGGSWYRVPDPFDCPPENSFNDSKSPICAWDEHWLETTVDHPQTYGTAFSGYVSTFGADLSDPDSLLWVTTQWVYRTPDGGAKFHNLQTREPLLASDWWRSRGVDNINMLDVAISPADPNRVYLGLFDMGCWRSLDRAKSWQSCNPTEPIPVAGGYFGWSEGAGGNVASIVADPTRADVVWTTMSLHQKGQYPTYLLRSDQSGARESWQQSDAGLPLTDLMGLSVDPTSSPTARTLFITAAGEVYRSIDDGWNWAPLSTGCGGGCRVTAVDHFDGDLVFAGGETGLFRSQDGGDSWSAIGLAEMRGRQYADLSWVGFWEWRWYGIFDIETHPAASGTLLVSSFGPGRGLYRSQDGGDSWDSSSGNGCPGANEPKILCDDQMRGVSAVAADPALIYVGSSLVFKSGGGVGSSRGVVVSRDSGQSWTEENAGLGWPLAIPVEIAPSDPTFVVVGSPGVGYARNGCVGDLDCDGQADGLDCRPENPTRGTPAAIADLRFAAGSTVTLTWSASLFSEQYELLRGDLIGLGAGDFGVCQNAADGDRSDTVFVDASVPPPGSAYAYLVRGANLLCGTNWGDDSHGQSRVNSNASDCP